MSSSSGTSRSLNTPAWSVIGHSVERTETEQGLRLNELVHKTGSLEVVERAGTTVGQVLNEVFKLLRVDLKCVYAMVCGTDGRSGATGRAISV